MTAERVKELHRLFPHWNVYEYDIQAELEAAEEHGYQLLGICETPVEGSAYFWHPDDEEIALLEIPDDEKKDDVGDYEYPLFRKVEVGDPVYKAPNLLIIAPTLVA